MALTPLMQPPADMPDRAKCGWLAAGLALTRGEGVRKAPRSKVPEWVDGWNARMAVER